MNSSPSSTTHSPSRKVPFVDLHRWHGPIHDRLKQAACSVIDRGCYILGPDVRAFEQELAVWLHVPEVCGVSCATSGLWALLVGLGIGPGDEVITTPLTAIATSEAISLAGAKVVFADIDPATCCLDPSKAREKITPCTKAIIPVHLYGHPADLDAFQALAKEHNLRLIEDCAQAQGARHRGAYVGTQNDAGVFSFFPSKNLGGFGDGGAVVARDPAVLKKARMFSNHGREGKYWHEFEGTNNRLDTIQAAMLRVALPRLEDWNAQRRAAAAWYDARLANTPGVIMPAVRPNCEPVYHVYVIRVADREGLAEHLQKHGVATGIHYPHALHRLPAYAHLGLGEGSLPEAEKACATVLSLPMFPGITEEEVDYICQVIRDFPL